MASLKTAIKNNGSRFFVNLVKTYMLDNNHRVHMELSPSETLELEIINQEKEQVKAFQSTLTTEALNSLKEQAQRLKDIQNTDDPPDVVATVPSLQLTDIDPSGVEYEIVVVENAYGSLATLTKNVDDGSAGIVYIDIGIDISKVDYNNIEMLPFIVSMLSENDTTGKTRVDLDRLIGMHTGGIDIALELLPLYEKGQVDYIASNNKKMRSFLFFRGKCTAEKTESMLNLMKAIAETSLPVTQERAILILERKISSYEASISSSGHSYSVMRMHARYDVQSFFDEKLYGINQLTSLKTLLDKATNHWDDFETRILNVMESFSQMYAAETVINLTGDLSSLEGIDGEIKQFVTSLKNGYDRPDLQNFHKTDHPWVQKALEEMPQLAPLRNEGIPISSQVSYVGKGGILFDYGEKVSGGSCVPLQYLKKGYLWETVRAKNGAYGVMASLDHTDGSLFMVSYRDPQLLKTIEAYDNAGQFLTDERKKGSITKQTIKTAIVGCIGSIDGSALPPRSVGWLAFRRYLSNSSAQRRQKWREEILSAKIADFDQFAKRLNEWKNTTMAVIAPASVLESGDGLELEIINL